MYFGRIVHKNMIIPPNVIVQASKSGKSSVENYCIFLNDVLCPLVRTKFLLILDPWRTRTNQDRVGGVFSNLNSQLLIYPERLIGHIQPQDLLLFRSWRYFH